MRPLYVIILGLVLFQGVFMAITGFFPYTGVSDTIDDYDDSVTGLKPSSFSFDIIEDNAVLILGTTTGFVLALIFKSYVACGLMLTLGILLTLIKIAWATVTNITNYADSYVITLVVDVMFIAIGILLVFAIIDYFAPAGATQ